MPPGGTEFSKSGVLIKTHSDHVTLKMVIFKIQTLDGVHTGNIFCVYFRIYHPFNMGFSITPATSEIGSFFLYFKIVEGRGIN